MHTLVEETMRLYCAAVGRTIPTQTMTALPVAEFTRKPCGEHIRVLIGLGLMKGVAVVSCRSNGVQSNAQPFPPW